MARTVTSEGQLAYRRKEAARMIGISISTLDRLVRTGAIQSVAVSPRTTVITAEELARYLVAQSVTVTRTVGGAE